jgi:NAD(P)-dependent dehydrogenase (short-subunit alcohol dehydrogenase family)
MAQPMQSTITNCPSPKEDFDQFNTNVFGMLNVCKAFLPYIRTTNGHRTVSNFGSIASWQSGAGYALYSGTKWACSGISEAMHAELAPLGIAVTVIEPGYFRTGFLNASARIQSEKEIKDYDETATGELRRMLGKVDNNQPGDVVKGSKLIIDILTKSGAAEGKDIPIRVALGSDSSPAIRGKIEATVKMLDEWDSIMTQTDHE